MTLASGLSRETVHVEIEGSDVKAVVEIDQLAAAVGAMADLKSSGDRLRERLAMMTLAYGGAGKPPEGPKVDA